jgi:signal transduction histidine kinase/CheY-like chemotaxis protein
MMQGLRAWLTGPQTAVHRPVDPQRDATLPDLVRSVFEQTRASLAGNLLGAVIVVLMFLPVAPRPLVLGWFGLFIGVWALRGLTLVRYQRANPTSIEDSRQWQRAWNIGTLASGALWGLSAWGFYGWGSSFHQTALLLIVYSFCVGSIPLLATQYRMFFAFISLCFVPTIARVATIGGTDGLELAGVLVLTFAMTAVLGRYYRQAFDKVIALKVRSEHLLEQLREEKAAADLARQEAEVANRAKTQFFAAASHDLRQPLHAVGLFAEALRNKSRDEEVIQLVNSINSSVDALEGLFSELLDITKIDTGAVEVTPQHFKLKDLFARLRLHYEPTAFEKGLELKFRGGQHHAYADPVLVDRILRNLISNAIRYTEDGGVLVSCRPRGDQLLLQVWDSGIGIRASEQERIFEEFYQVQGEAPLQAHHRKGLGLGLAIVKRLSGLMNAPLSLKSRPGHGTVFSLVLPLGKAQRAPEPIPGRTPLGLTLERKLIAVVEDEPAVRDGLEVLLKGWGATVAAFDNVEGARQWAAHAHRQGQKPDLAIVDYRIDHQSTGVDAIRALRAEFGADMPAIVVTGSTTASLDDEAHRHDFHLLIKPVVPNKLRAMIAFKLGVRAR